MSFLLFTLFIALNPYKDKEVIFLCPLFTVGCSVPITGPDAIIVSGCRDTSQSAFAGYAIPLVNAGADISICKGTPRSLVATGAASYSCTPASGLSCTQCASPDASPLQETNYIITGTSAQGCINKDFVKVTVQLPLQYFKSLFEHCRIEIVLRW